MCVFSGSHDVAVTVFLAVKVRLSFSYRVCVFQQQPNLDRQLLIAAIKRPYEPRKGEPFYRGRGENSDDGKVGKKKTGTRSFFPPIFVLQRKMWEKESCC